MHAVEIPKVGRRHSGNESDSAHLDNKVVEDLEIAQTCEGDDMDILQDVIWRATQEMWGKGFWETVEDADS